MLTVVYSLLAGFGFVVWRSFRKDRAAAAKGDGYQPPAGRIRW